MDTSISVKGQVVIPAEIRRKYGLQPGTVLHVVDHGDGILLKPVTLQSVHALRGILRGGGGIKALLEERAKEAEREIAYDRSYEDPGCLRSDGFPGG